MRLGCGNGFSGGVSYGGKLPIHPKTIPGTLNFLVSLADYRSCL